MSLRARVILLCAGFLVLVTSASALGAVLVLRANDARRDYNDLKAASVAAKELEDNYIGQAASIRAYFLTGDSSAFDVYNERRALVGDLNGQLRGLLMGTDLVDDISRLADAARAWRNDAILPLITLSQQGETERVIAQYRDGPAVPRFELLADGLSALRRTIANSVARADRSEDAARTQVTRFAVGSVIGLIAMFGLLSLISRWWIARPLGQLSAAVREPDEHAPPVPRRGAREILRLATDVTNLRDRLRDEIDLATRTREGLAQEAAVLMSVRAQLETSPDNLPAGWSVAAQLVPAAGIVAGDCYTVDVVGRDQMTVVIVDVAGHGASSAVVALRAKELLRAAVRSYDDPSDAVTWVSTQLTDLENDMFVTGFVARLDFRSGLVRFVNAGHPEAIICDSVNVVELAPTGPLIGPFSGTWTTREAIIGPGQMLVCYTDGLIEVRDESAQEFGRERLHKVLRASYGKETDTIVKQCLAEVDSFSHGRAHDDLTLTVIARGVATTRR
jgi:serine phosphatase RsbU (regulator of sigma subunit)/CHASE3 domain sensor protein